MEERERERMQKMQNEGERSRGSKGVRHGASPGGHKIVMRLFANVHNAWCMEKDVVI